ncbi:MFS transporter, partial [Kordiimonas pumila]
MTNSSPINIEKYIDDRPFGFFQVKVVFLCVCIALLEGYDTQVIGFAAPGIAAEWSVSRASLGLAFSSSLFGLMLGALFLGPAADRYGRRILTITCFGFVGLFTLLSAYVTSIDQLVVLRFLTGLGIGGTMPGAIALVSEYSPKRYRALSVTIMACGFPLGSVLGGIVAAPLISEFGWRSSFILGGVLPILLTVLLFYFLPESIKFLAAKPSKVKEASKLLACVDNTYTPREEEIFEVAVGQARHVRFKDIFSEGRLAGSLILWLLFALNLLMLYLMISWLPTILTEAGFNLEKAIIAMSLFSAGGIVASLFLGRVADRSSPYIVLLCVYIFAACITAVMSMSGLPASVLLVLVFFAGVGILGPQLVLNALAANFYPSNIRSAGVGASLSAGRIGAIVGPLAGSVVMSLGLPPTQVFLMLTVPSLICAVAIWRLGKEKSSDVLQPRAIREFDHLMCGVKDINLTAETFKALGFTVGPVTPLEGIGVVNSRILLTPKQKNLANYIEFMQLGGAQGEIPSFLQKWLKGSLIGKEGAHSLIMRTDDAQNTYNHFEKLHKENPQGGFAPYLLKMDFDQDGPDGEMYSVGFSNCIMPDLEPPLYVSTSEIRTLDFYLNTQWRTHRNGAISWTETIAISDEPETTAMELQELWGGEIAKVNSGCFVCGPSEMPLKVFSKKAFCEEYGDTVIADIGYSVKNAY